MATAAGNIVLHRNPPCRLTLNVAANPLELNLSGGFGQYAVESSTDLAQWQTLTNFYLGQGSFTFTDGRGLPGAYYRAVLLPSL